MAKDLIESFIEAIKPEEAKTDNVYSATVSKVEKDGTVWVYVAGSDKATPTASTSSEVKQGDAVTVEWRNNRLYIAGNTSNPSVGVSRVISVENAARVANEAAQNAVADAGVARQAAESAQADAEAAGQAVITVNNNLKSVVQGATTVEKAVSVMQTALEAVVDYDPQNDTVDEYFWHDANGAHVLGTSGDYRADIKSTGMNIVDTDTETSVAEFGASEARIGKEYVQGANDNESYMALDYHSLQMIDKEGNPYVYLSDLRGSDGTWLVPSFTFVGDGFTNTFFFNFQAANTDYTVSVSDLSGGNISKHNNRVYFNTAPNDGAIITVDNFYTTSNLAKAFTFGARNDAVGAMSFVVGADNSASGNYSCAVGENTTASGECSHAEGRDTTASGEYSHTEGSDTTASGDNSHAQNRGTIASSDDQTAVGSYNIEDDSDTYAFIIGNGASNLLRSNALTVDWSGNVKAAGDIYPQNTQMTDFVVEQGTSGDWSYRKWKSGKIEAWASHAFGSQTGTAWASQWYKDLTYSLPSGLFSSAPMVIASSGNASWAVYGASASTTTISLRAVRNANNAAAMTINFYCIKN